MKSGKKTRDKLTKIISNHEEEIKRLNDLVDSCIEKGRDYYEKANDATKALKDFKTKTKYEFAKRGMVIGNLVSMIQGIVVQTADPDRLPVDARIPKFVDE